MINKRYPFISLSLLALFSSCSLQPDPLPISLFSLKIDKSTSTITQGSSSTAHLSITDPANGDALVSSDLVLREVSAGNRPSGISIRPNLPFTLYGGKSDFNVNVDATVAPGKYSFSVGATLPGKTTFATNTVEVEIEVLKQNNDWVKQFGTTDPDGAVSVTTDSKGNVYIAGVTSGALPGQTNSGNLDAFIRKYDINGNQLWTKQFGTTEADYAISVATDPSGNVYVVGHIDGTLSGQTSLGDRDSFVRKYDSNGNDLWTQQFGTSGDDRANSVAVDSSGNIYVTGGTDGTFSGQKSLGERDAFIRKYDTNGTEIWTQQFGTNTFDIAASVTTDSSGGILFTGTTYGTLPGQTNSGYRDTFIRKYDTNGTEIWTKQFGTNDFDSAFSVATDSSGNVYVAGSTGGTLPGQVNLGKDDVFIRKYDINGNALWTRQFGTTELDVANSVTTDSSGNVYLTGVTAGTLSGQTHLGKDDAFIRKYDSNGNQLWTKQFGTTDLDGAASVTTDHEGNIYVSGGTVGAFPGQVNLGSIDAFLYKFAP